MAARNHASVAHREPVAPNPKRSDVRAAAQGALLALLEPLAGFVLDSGISTSELQLLIRVAAVRSVAARQLELSDRTNISGIAAATGLSRAEVAKILKINIRQREQNAERHQQATNRILSAWHDDPRFAKSNGQPMDLPIFGAGITFESLVRKYGRGIPTRAVLDELLRTRSVEVFDGGQVRALTIVAVDRGMSPRAIKVFGDRTSDLLKTMLANMREPNQQQFISSVGSLVSSEKMLPILRRDISSRGADFLDEVRETLVRGEANDSGKSKSRGFAKVSVTVFYNEARRNGTSRKAPSTTRRNLRRSLLKTTEEI